MLINLEKKKENAVCFTACLVILATSIISLSNGIIRQFVTLPLKLDTLFVYGIIILIVLFSLKTILSRSSYLVYGIITFLFFWYLIAFMINSYYYDYFVKFGLDFLLSSVPWFIVAYAARDSKLLKKYLYISALIIMISFIMNFYVFKIDIFGEYTYSQEFTYGLLPVPIIIGNSLFEKFRLFDVLIFLTSIFFIFSLGARGPLVCVVLFLIIKILLMCKFKPKKAILINFFIISIIVPFYIYFYEILTYLLNILQKVGLNSRTILRLIEGSFFEDNARNLLSKYSIDLIRENPLIGVGVGNDRILLGNKMGSSDIFSEAVGWYPHNLFLEILLHFGIIIGGIIILALIKILYTTTFKNKNTDDTDIICIFIGLGLFPLLFSGSYITSPLFFSLLGFSLFQYKKLRTSYY